MTEDSETPKPTGPTGMGSSESDAVDDWLAVPLFELSEGEQLEELATYGLAPLRPLAAVALAVRARRSGPRRPSAGHRRGRRGRTPVLPMAMAAIAVGALAAAVGFGAWPQGHLHADPAAASHLVITTTTTPPPISTPAAPATLTTLPLLTSTVRPPPPKNRPPSSSTTTSSSGPTPTTTIGDAVHAPSLAPTPVPVVQPDAPLDDPLPVGKFQWVSPDATAASVAQIATDAAAAGLDYLVVNLSNPTSASALLGALIPATHAAGLRVVAAELSLLADPTTSAAQAIRLASFASQGQHLDGLISQFTTALTSPSVAEYAGALRAGVGSAYPLVAAFPAATIPGIDPPTAATVADFNAVAPLVTLTSEDPAAQVTALLASLSTLGQPLLPVATGNSMTDRSLTQFIAAADQGGAVGVGLRPPSSAAPTALSSTPQFDLRHIDPADLLPSQIRPIQAELASLGLPVALTGILDQPTTAALATYQQAAKLEPTGQLSTSTSSLLLAPVQLLVP